MLICGGTNCVGPHIIKEFLNDDRYAITILTRGNKRVLYEDVYHIKGDVKDADAMRNISLHHKHFDVIIDTIAYSAESVINILSNIETERYIQISTVGVYETTERDVKENDFDPHTYSYRDDSMSVVDSYVNGKRAAEAVAVQKYDIVNPVIIRPYYVLDSLRPDLEQNVRIWDVVNCIRNNLCFNSKFLRSICCFTDALEEARMCKVLADNSYTGAINCCSDGYVTVQEMVEYVEKRMKKEAMYSNEGTVTNFVVNKKMNTKFYKELMGGDIPILKDWLWKLFDFYIENNDLTFGISWNKLFSQMYQ